MSESEYEAMTKYEYVENLNTTDYGRSNFVNTAEEETLLEYVESFRRQFIQLFPSRHESLYLSPLNEFGVRKFVCCSIRPTLQRFVPLWDYKQAAEFVSSFLSYDPLQDATQAPDLLISNHILLHTRRGDCLDYSNLLCSLLRGSGYNAFVVYGIAKECITQNDQTKAKISDAILQETAWNLVEANEVEINNESQNEFQIPSFYAKKAHAQKTKRMTYKEYLMDKENALLSTKKENVKEMQAKEKECEGVHFWVLIKRGLRDVVDHDLFIEAVSGCVYQIKGEEMPFIRVESIWNDANYWVNVQQTSIGDMSWDLADTKCFEFLLFDNTWQKEKKGEVLTLPSGWQKPFFFRQKHIDNACPEEGITIQYDGCKLERFNRFCNKNGLTMKVTLLGGETRQIFCDRHDLLMKRVTLVEENETRTYELFDVGRVSGLFQLITVARAAAVHKRITIFYPNARTDGLIRRVETVGAKAKVILLFEDRNDGIVRRAIEFEDGAVMKVEEFYHNKNILKLTFDVFGNEYMINYRFGEHRILSKHCVFNKKTGSVHGWNPDPMNKNPNTTQLKEQFEELMAKEKSLLTQIRERERAFALLLKQIHIETQLKRDPYTVAKEIKYVEKEEDSEEEEEEEEEDEEYCMLHSFLPKTKDIRSLNKEQMDQIKEDCLRSLKERLLQRLNIITKRLHAQCEALGAIKIEYENWQNNDIDHAGDNNSYTENQQLLNERKEAIFNRHKKECEFKINIIKRRLSAHERQSIQKMNQLAQLLDTYHTQAMIANINV
eukprot:338579_1